MSTKSGQPKPPPSLGSEGRKMWRETVAVYELEPHERRLLREACGVLDAVAALEAVIADEGHTSVGSTGQRVVHPAVSELRLQRLAYARLLGVLALPTEDGTRLRTGHQARSHAAHAQRWGNVREMKNRGA